MKPFVIFGSSRGDGETLKAVQEVIKGKNIDIVDLQKLNIGYYDYSGGNRHDDFIPLAERMIEHNPLILASPIYWYSVSALMKTFIDRWSDLISIRKDLGRKLAGKDLFLVTSYAGEVPRNFEDPMKLTCQYLDMHYRGCYYHYSGPDKIEQEKNKERAAQFIQTLWKDAPP